MAIPSSQNAPETVNFKVIILGSDLEATLPRDLPLFYQDGVLIDRRNGTPMEMDAYSVYLALKACKLAYGRDYLLQQGQLVDSARNSRLAAASVSWRLDRFQE